MIVHPAVLLKYFPDRKPITFRCYEEKLIKEILHTCPFLTMTTRTTIGKFGYDYLKKLDISPNTLMELKDVGTMLAIWFTLGSYMVYEYFQVEEDFRVVRFENLKIGQTPGDYEVPDIRLLSHMGSMLRAARQQAVPGMTAEELENLRKASLRFPYGSLGLRNALALGLNGDPAGATRQMAVIRGMYGEGYYQAAVSVLRDLQAEKYPELAKVITP